MEKKEDKKFLAKIPYEIWVYFRRLQEEGEVKSVQDAALQAFELFFAAKKKEKSEK